MEKQQQPRPVYWAGAVSACEYCKRPIGNTMVDGRLRTGPWAVLDLRCHREHGVGVGVGKGQVYKRQEDGRWLKVEG
jgi:hypothetical protein